MSFSSRGPRAPAEPLHRLFHSAGFRTYGDEIAVLRFDTGVWALQAALSSVDGQPRVTADHVMQAIGLTVHLGAHLESGLALRFCDPMEATQRGLTQVLPFCESEGSDSGSVAFRAAASLARAVPSVILDFSLSTGIVEELAHAIVAAALRRSRK